MGDMTGVATLRIRRATPADRPAVLALLRGSLGWAGGDDGARFLDWKHRENPFGPSPSWIAVDEDRVVGFRTFLRWEFEQDGRVVRAVRAVDTATDPAHRGRGIFTRLTLQALDELRDEGIAFVFNTPNDQSRPGYLKMGWQPVGHLPMAVRLRGPATLPLLRRARGPADLASAPSDAGVTAGEALDAGAVPDAGAAPAGGLRTRRTPAFLRWRYGSALIRYRALATRDGLVVFRLRRRGAAVETAVLDVLPRDGSARRRGRLLRHAAREAGADYALRLGGPGAGYLPLPRQGPLLVCRPLAATAVPGLADWHLALGDIELF